MGGLKVLAVEDTIPQVNSVLKLGSDERVVFASSHTQDVISRFEEEDPDVVLFEYNGQKEQLETLYKMSQIKTVPIIFIFDGEESKNEIDSVVQVSTIGFVQKPIRSQDLLKTLELIQSKHLYESKLRELGGLGVGDKQEYFFVRIGNNLKRIDVNAIQYVEVEEKYCSIYADNRQFHVKIALKDFLKKLPETKFIRVHRSFVVNVDFISTIKLNENMIFLGEHKIPFSRTYKDQLFSGINLI